MMVSTKLVIRLPINKSVASFDCFSRNIKYFQNCFCHESLFWVRKRGLLFSIWYKHLEVPFCLFWFWTYQNRITRHGFMQLENWDFGNKFRWYLGKNVEFFMKKIVWKYPFVLFIGSRITSLFSCCIQLVTSSVWRKQIQFCRNGKTSFGFGFGFGWNILSVSVAQQNI